MDRTFVNASGREVYVVQISLPINLAKVTNIMFTF